MRTPDPDDIAGMPRDAHGPVFGAPWQAQAFALTVIAEVRSRGDADTGERYYEHWLTALERIATRKGLVDDIRLLRRRDEWEDAARNTPHGRPIVLPPRA
jgi:hypothetical protein